MSVICCKIIIPTQHYINWQTHQKYFPRGVLRNCKKGVLRNFAKFTGKYLCQSLFFNKVAGLRSATLFKKRLWHRCFPLNLAKFLRIPFPTEHLWWLFLTHKMRKQVSSLIVEVSLYMVHHSNAHIFSLILGEAKQRFDNLKKRFSKKKSKYKKATKSGSGSREAKQAETELKKYDSLSWFAPYLRLKGNTVSNLPNTNVAEIKTNDDDMTEAEDNSSDCSEKSLFSSVSTNQSFETPWKRIAKWKKVKKRSNKLQKNQARS